MSEDDSIPAPDPSERHSEKRRTWLDRLSSAFSGEPSSRDDLVELLRDAHGDGLIAADTLRMMEGAIAVADLTVGDVMISRSQMVSLPVASRFLDLMKEVVESGHSRFPVHGENKDEILGILLAKDLLRRGVRAIEAFGDLRSEPLHCVLPAEHLLAVGFKTVRPHPRWPRLRLELKSTVTWREDVEVALERLLGSMKPEGILRPVGGR